MANSLLGLRKLVALCIVAAAQLVPSAAAAQPFDARETGWEGLKGFVDLARRDLGDARVVSTNKLDWRELSPSDGLVIVHPDVVADGDELSAFLRAGGRVALLDDFGVGDQILTRYQIKRVPAPSAPLYMLRNNPRLALAEPVSELMAGRRGGVHPVVADVSRLVTNHPSGLIHPDLSTVLKIRASGEADVALAVAGQVGKGRLFAMSDPSAVINLMLRYPSNRAFASGLVRYLVEEDTAVGARGGKLVVVSGKFEELGAYGSESGLLREVKDVLRTIKAEVSKVGREGLPKGVSLGLAVACAAGLLMWAFSSAARTYRKTQPRFARSTPLLAQGGVAGRAAVLSSESTHRGLILLEQRDALEEELGHMLGLDGAATMNVLLERIERDHLLDAATMGDLRKVFLDMAQVETAISAGTPVRVPLQKLERAATVARAVSAAISARLKASGQGVNT